MKLTDEGPILITGAAGLVGSQLAETLAARFPDLYLLTPTRSELDLEDIDAVRKYWTCHRPNGVFHLAAFVRGLGGNLSAGQAAFEVNARINHNVLMAGIEFPPEFFFAAGTVALYGHPYPRLPLTEADAFVGDPHGGELFYSLAKRAMLPYLQAMEVAGGTNTTLGLFTNIYGPRDRFDEVSGHVVPSLVKRFVEAEQLDRSEVVVWGRPDTTRDFMYVQDAIDALLQVIAAKLKICNIASGRERQMGELVDSLRRVTGYRGSVRWDADKPTGIPRRCVDISQLSELNADANFVSLEDGLVETVRWYRENMGTL